MAQAGSITVDVIVRPRIARIKRRLRITMGFVAFWHAVRWGFLDWPASDAES